MIEASAGIISAGEPSPADEDIIDESEMAQIDEDRLQELGMSLAGRREEWLTARRASGVEKRWMEDLDQYHGRDDSTKQAASMMESAEQGYPVLNRNSKPQRSTVYVNITRPKTNAFEARVANMVLPSDDRNWGLKPSPVPELVKAALAEAKQKANIAAQQNQASQQQTSPSPTPQGQPAPGQPPVDPNAQPATLSAQAAPAMPAPQGIAQSATAQPLTAQEKLEEADDRCKAMQNEIDDQLMDCQFNGECRKMLHDVCVLGTGILKGPIVVNRSRKAWSPMKHSKDKSVFVLEMVEEKKPASECVSPWNIITDPGCGDNPHNGRGIFEYRTMSTKQMRDLVGQPGYLEDQIAKVLEEGPQQEVYDSENDQRHKSDNAVKNTDKDHYQLWEYWGEFTPEDLRAAGVDIADSSTESISGCVIFVNQTVIKGFLNPIETGDLPYDFMNLELVDGSVWGYGVPFLMRPSQRVLNAAWRQLMDNSGLSVGPQIFMKRKGITPQDGIWQLTGRKVWLVDEDINPNDAFRTVDIQNHGQEIQQIIELAMKFADEEANIPAIAQGEKGNAPDTVGGITILMNSSNVVLGRIVKQFDDCITRPHLRRYYDWNMAYSDNALIKGDFQVDARGSSALLVRDMQAQSLMQLGQYQASPAISSLVNWEAWFKQVLKLQHIDPTDIMKTESEIAQMQSTPPSPPIQLAVEQAKGQNALQLQQAKSQAEAAQIQAEAAHEQQLLQTGGASPHQAQAMARIEQERIRASSSQTIESSRANAEAARAQKELEIAQQNGEYDIRKLELQREIAILEYTSKQNITLTQAKAQLAQSGMNNDTKKQLADAEIQLAQSEGDKDRTLDLHKHTSNVLAKNNTPSLVQDQMGLPNTP